MNISKQNTDDLTATLTLSVEKADYAEKVESVLKDYRKNAQIPGFRKGKVPMGMIRKQHAMSVQMEEINKLISQELQKYISEADFKILGEPLPSDKQETLDFDTQENFDFIFEVGIQPTIELEISDKDTVVAYEINVEPEAVEKQMNQFASQYAEMTNPDEAEARDMVRGDVAQLNADGSLVEGGVLKEGAVLMPERITDEAVKANFIGAKVGANIVFNPSTALGNAEEAATFLGLEKDAVVDADFKMTVTEITRYVDAEVNEKLFKKVYPNEDFATEEDFKKRVEEDIQKGQAQEGAARFEWEARDYIVDKLKDVVFPEAFLKRWITVSNEEREDFDAAKLDADFPKVLDDLRWQLASSYLAEKAELKVEADDPMKAAKQLAAQQFAMYGMGNLPEEYYDDYAKKMLEDKSQAEHIINKVMTDKVIAYIKENVKLKTKKVSMDDFKKLYEEK